MVHRKVKIIALSLLLVFAFGGVCTTLAAPGQALGQRETGKESPCAGGWMWMDMDCDPPAVMCGSGLVSALSSNPALLSSFPNEGSKSPHYWIANGQPADFPPQILAISKNRRYLSGDLVVHPTQKTSIHLFNSVLTL